MLRRAIRGCGVEEARAGPLSGEVRRRFVDGSRGWRRFEDSLAALALTRTAGWRNVILSNHVPELPELVATLGLRQDVEQIFTSALIGYEKPHPEAFNVVLAACGAPRRSWMVGDNPLADVAGAEAVGIPAVLVRHEGEARRRAPDALAAAELILEESATGRMPPVADPRGPSADLG